MPGKSAAAKPKPVIEIKKADDPSLPKSLAEYLQAHDLVLAPNAAIKVIQATANIATSKEQFREQIKALDCEWLPIESFPTDMSLAEMELKRDRLEHRHELKLKRKAKEAEEGPKPKKDSKKKRADTPKPSRKKSKKNGTGQILEKLDKIEERLTSLEADEEEDKE